MTEEKNDSNTSLDALLSLNAKSSSKQEGDIKEDKSVVDSDLESGDLVISDNGPVKKVHIFSGVKVLATKEEFEKYQELHTHLEEASKDKNLGELSHSDPYWDTKAVLDTFVAHLERA